MLGEPAEIVRRRAPVRTRRIVLLLDVSGSMAPYAESLLRLAHHWVSGGIPIEVFTVGTRSTRVTDALRDRDPERAVRGRPRSCRTGPAARASVTRSRTSWTAGAPAARSGRGGRRPQRRLGARRRAGPRRADGAVALLADRVVWASPHVAKPATSRCSRASCGVAAHRRLRRGPLAARLRRARGGGHACVRCCPTCCAGGAREPRWAWRRWSPRSGPRPTRPASPMLVGPSARQWARSPAAASRRRSTSCRSRWWPAGDRCSSATASATTTPSPSG